LEHICYLTGYEDPAIFMYHALIISADEPVMVIRRYEEANAPEFTWLTKWVTIEDHEHPGQVVARVVEKLGLATAKIGIEKGLNKNGLYFWIDEYEAIKAALPKATFVDAASVVAEVRLVKSPLEIGAMRDAARIAEAAVDSAVKVVRPGATENDVASEFYRAMISGGGEYTSLTPFFLSGERTSLPHGTWRQRTIEDGDPFYFEVSGNSCRYEVPVMRTALVGEPRGRVRAMANAALDALAVGLDTIRPGVTGEAVHEAILGTMEKAGFGGDYYKHPSGYTIGISFPPAWSETHYFTLARGEKKRLEPNMTFHVVPIALMYRQAGIGFSASVRVTEKGCEPLTNYPRTLEMV
jgi:Xaa-Pro dipeptidase